MSLAGVRSNRGDGYQTLIAFEWALKVITNDIYQWIEVDTTDLDANGKPISVDDVLIGLVDGTQIACQCKKNQKNFDSWIITELGDELKKASAFISQNMDARVVFYTRGAFGAIAKLREHCITQPNEQAYKASLTSENHKTNTELTSYLGTVNPYDFLQRTTFECTSELHTLQHNLIDQLKRIVSNANAAFNALWTAIDMLGARMTNDGGVVATSSHRLSKADLKKIVETAGANFIAPRSEHDLKQSFADTSSVGRHWCREIGGVKLHGLAVDTLLAALDDKKKSILLTGLPGSGKTCVLLELQESLETRNDVAALYIQAREYANSTTPEARAS